jgi:hypothetical protein
VRWRRSHRDISEDQQIGRYAHVLGTVPGPVADRAYAAAFESLSASQRAEIVSELSSRLPDGPPDGVVDDPEAFAMLMRDLGARYAIVTVPGAAALAAAFVASSPIVTYFTTGTGSVSIDQQPPWLHELTGHETAPIDAGRNEHYRGPDYRI